mmetsp:Transcript_12632/g.26161  ORF Transcript_12632/g.26161 Transcript_12632/m.26161 type:complete len:206 (-) Transcript_12632:156-773(-)
MFHNRNIFSGNIHLVLCFHVCLKAFKFIRGQALRKPSIIALDGTPVFTGYFRRSLCLGAATQYIETHIGLSHVASHFRCPLIIFVWISFFTVTIVFVPVEFIPIGIHLILEEPVTRGGVRCCFDRFQVSRRCLVFHFPCHDSSCTVAFEFGRELRGWPQFVVAVIKIDSKYIIFVVGSSVLLLVVIAPATIGTAEKAIMCQGGKN